MIRSCKVDWTGHGHISEQESQFLFQAHGVPRGHGSPYMTLMHMGKVVTENEVLPGNREEKDGDK